MKVLTQLFVALSVVMLACYIAVHGAGISAYRVAEGATNATVRIDKVPVFVMMVPIRVPWPFGPWELFAALFVFYSLLLVLLAFMGGSNAVSAAKRAVEEGVRALFDNAFWGVSILSSASIVAMIALQTLQEPVLPTGKLEFPTLLDEFLSASWAPVAEEVGFRLTVVGLIVALSCVGRTTLSEKLLAFIYPWKLRERVGPSLDITIAVGIVLASVPFGLLHVLAGWGPGKATIAALAGVTLGYLYARYSIAASIMAHWTYNYYTETVSILAGASEFVGFLAFFLLVYGVASLALVAYILLERLLVRAT